MGGNFGRSLVFALPAADVFDASVTAAGGIGLKWAKGGFQIQISNRHSRLTAALLIAAAIVPAIATSAGAASFEPSAALRAAPNNNIGMHSMLYLNTPFGAQEEMFAQAQAVGASYIRVDLALSAIFTRGDYRGRVFYQTNWTQSDQYAALANRYGVKVLVNLFATPWFIADCPAGVTRADSYHCPTSDLGRYKALVGEVADRYAGLIDDFEIINEPDNAGAFYGTAQQYSAMLSAAADGIHAANPQARVAIGGIATITNSLFTDAVLAADPSVAAKVDINTIHLRTSVADAAKRVDQWRKYYDAHLMKGPLWVTEFGYSADSAFQSDVKFTGGEAAQATYLAAAMPVILGAGGEKIFVTQRDWGTAQFEAEGILDVDDPLPAAPIVRRRPAFSVVQQAAASLVGTPFLVSPVVPRASVPKAPALLGAAKLAAIQSRRVWLAGSSVTLRFSCASPNGCAQTNFRLRQSSKQTYLLKVGAIGAGSSTLVGLKLSAASLRAIRAAGKPGLRVTLTRSSPAQSYAIMINR